MDNQQIVSTIVYLIVAVLLIIANWKIFVKAGEAGWKSIIPFYNIYILFKISFGNGLWFLLLFVPIANIVIEIILCYKLAKVFGKGIGFTLGLIFLPNIFSLILGFGSAEYIGIKEKSK